MEKQPPTHTPENLKAFQVFQLNVSYDKVPVLWDISLEVPQGHLVAIIGPNGAGKTTLIKTALGLVSPISGTIEFLGHPLEKMRKRIAYVPQRESVDWDFPITARDLVLMGRYGQLGLFRWPRKADRVAAERCLDQVAMLPFADRQISQLSGGQQQRIFLARALLQDADLYFMDEPFVGIDLASENVIMDLLRRLREEGKTIIVVQHDLNTIKNRFDWVILLNMRLIASGPVNEVFTPDFLNKTYGKNDALLDEVFKLSGEKSAGLK